VKLIVIISILLILTSCSLSTVEGQPAYIGDVELNSENSIGQTFVAHYDGLDGLEISFTSNIEEGSQGTLYIRTDPHSSENIREVQVPGQLLKGVSIYRFNFSPINDSRQKYYYAVFEMDGGGSLAIGTLSGDSYLDGSIYKNHVPFDAQMDITLQYDIFEAGLGIIIELLKYTGLLIIACIVFIIPGWGILSALWDEWMDQQIVVKAVFSVGFCLALYPVLLLWTDVFGIHLWYFYVWIPVIAGLFIIIWRNRSVFRLMLSERKSLLKLPTNLKKRIYGSNFYLLLLMILLLVFFVRFWVVRTLDVPMWGDSYHHTMISQLIVDNGGLFDSWEPYAALDSFSYHYGFHSAVAAFNWITSSDISRTVLWVGQIINVLVVLALYPLGLRIGGTKWAGLGAVIVAGLLVPIPMSYVNWGRYTQLSGLMILPVCAYLIWEVVKSKEIKWGLIFCLWIMLAGIGLTHYRVLIFSGLFLIALFIVEVWNRNILSLILRMMIIGVGALILFSPWLVQVFGSTIMDVFQDQISTPASKITESTQQYNSIGNITNYLPAWIWLSSLIILLWGIIKRTKGVILIGLWWALILLAANPHWFSLPGTGVISNFAIFISSFIPAGLLLGTGFGWVYEKFEQSHISKYKSLSWTVYTLFGLIIIWGAFERLGDIDIFGHALTTRPDVRASVWIRDYLPQNARILVNSFFAYDETIVVGSDGGWWLPLLAKRKTTLPPITYAFEESGSKDFDACTTDLLTDIKEHGLSSQVSFDRMTECGITHVYVGQRQGRVNYSGPYVIDPLQLLSDEHYQLIYHQDRVWMFELVPET
jgi:hypothetical protein